MLIFAVPFNVKHIDGPFLKAFLSMRDFLTARGVALIIIDSRFVDQKHLKGKVASIASWVDGIIFPGNPYSIDPRIYAEAPLDSTRIDPEPKNFEFAKLLIESARVKTIPILGICAGAWYLNVALGGSLVQDITTFAPEEQHVLDPRDGRVAHDIRIACNTRAYSIFQSDWMRVNSWHDQAIGRLGRGLRVSATSPQGIPEIIEEDSDSFFVGIQFHPEYLLAGDINDDYLSREDIRKQKAIFVKMVDAAIQRAKELPGNAEIIRTKEVALAFYQSRTELLLNAIKLKVN